MTQTAIDTAAPDATEADAPKAGAYRYRLSNTGYGSQRYGDCAVCHKHCDSVYSQIEEKEHVYPQAVAEEFGHPVGWTHHGCVSLFGHQECLISKQR